MRKILTIILINVIPIITILISTAIMHNKFESQFEKNEILQARIDSLNEVIIESNIDNGRYQIIIDRIRENDSNIVINASKNLE